MKKIVIGVILCGILIFLCYFVGQYLFLRDTTRAPYCNLMNIQNDNCYVFFNIRHRGSVYPVVRPYFMAEDRFVPRRFRYFGPLYFNEVIKRELALSVSDSVFTYWKGSIVDQTLIEGYRKNIILGDSTLIVNGVLSDKLSYEQTKAIVYVLLQQGINCCLIHDSGQVRVRKE